MELVGSLDAKSAYGRQQIIDHQARVCEELVSDALRSLWGGECYVFDGLILPTMLKDLRTAQVDHIVVSRYGIFCIETKSSHGYIYGRRWSKSWKQYVRDGECIEIHSPFRQNYHHSKAIEYSLGSLLNNQKVNLFICYPNARKIMLDGIQRDASIAALVKNIQLYSDIVYNDDEVETIKRRLEVALSFKEILSNVHRAGVSKHIAGSGAGIS